MGEEKWSMLVPVPNLRIQMTELLEVEIYLFVTIPV